MGSRAVIALLVLALGAVFESPDADAQRATGSRLDSPFDQIGKRCKRERLDPKHGLTTACAANRRVAIVRTSPYKRIPVAAKTLLVVDYVRIGRRAGNGLTVAIEGDRLWVREITCAMCRAIQGRTVLIDLSNLDAKLARHVQRILGLRVDIALVGAAAWTAELKAHQRSVRARISARQCTTDADCVATTFAGCCPHCSCLPWYPANRSAAQSAQNQCNQSVKCAKAQPCRTCTKAPKAVCRRKSCVLLRP